jgi:pyrroloquinoline quinone biosynthesis protein B
MRVKILGSAAGGGFPQWNCSCPNCQEVRGGTFAGKPRLQTQVAVSGDGDAWYLLGASPDLRAQIESFPALYPQAGSLSSPIRGVILASADLDHVLGLLLLRELHPFQVWASESVLQVLRGNSMFKMLNRAEDQVRWNEVGGREFFSLTTVAGVESGIVCHAVSVSSKQPAYAASGEARDAIVGIVLTSQSGKSLGFFPQLPQLTSELKDLFAGLDYLLLDGTFWSDDELAAMRGSGQLARQMGHIPVSGEDGTMRQLAGLSKPRKLYIHINNTNPMLNPAGAEYREMRECGWDLAEDGCQFNL